MRRRVRHFDPNFWQCKVFWGVSKKNDRSMTLQWIRTPPECQNLRFSIKSMLGMLVRRTSIPLRYLQLELRASPHANYGEK